MTQLRKVMLEELQRRNYSQTTVSSYIKTVADFAKYFRRRWKKPGIYLFPSELCRGKNPIMDETSDNRIAHFEFFRRLLPCHPAILFLE